MKILAMLMLMAGFFTMSCAQGQVWSPLLKDTPLSRFSEEDIALFEAARNDALNNRPDGAAVSWKNPETGASGTVIALDTKRSGGRKCRLLRLINRADGREGDSRFWFCKQPDGSWKISSPESQND